ncbi:hypothetical protein MASR2M15_14680 [Anaerolineales bacterium]
MVDITVVGGGLAGLAACATLEAQQIDYRLIEVKGVLGGSIQTVRYEETLIDTGIFAFDEAEKNALEQGLGLEDAFFPINRGFAFKQGSVVLIDHFRKQIQQPILYRMAVSSVGYEDGDYLLCLENGMLLNSKAILLAVPARYLERMFYGYIPELSEIFRSFYYDYLMRVNLIYEEEKGQIPDSMPPSMDIPFLYWTDSAYRVAAGHLLMQLGVRVFDHFNEVQILESIRRSFGFEHAPVYSHMSLWREADLMSPLGSDHGQQMEAIKQLLPEGIAICGSDFRQNPSFPKGLGRVMSRIEEAQAESLRLIEYIKRT